jgi:hypothetical protein
VPRSIASPYKSDISRALKDEGILEPLYVSSDMELIEDLADTFIKYLDSPEGKAIMYRGASGRRSHIHPDKLSPGLRRLAQIHPDKLPSEIHHLLLDAGVEQSGAQGWLLMDKPLANYYMTLLATRLSTRIGASAVTDETTADGLNLVVKTDAALPNPTTLYADARRWPGRRHLHTLAPVELAEGALATLALDGVRVRPDVPMARLVEFRRTHSAELGRFRTAIAGLASQIESELPLDAMRQRVWDLYSNELQPATEDLRRALAGRRVKSLTDALFKASFLSAGSGSLLLTLGLTVPQALLAGAGISLIATAVLYNLRKSDEIRSNPYSYLLCAQHKLGKVK